MKREMGGGIQNRRNIGGREKMQKEKEKETKKSNRKERELNER